MKKKLGTKIIHSITGFIALPFLALPTPILRSLLVNIFTKKARLLSSTNSLKFLFEIEKTLYEEEGKQSKRYGGGIHSKHKHTNYHNFFIENIGDHDTVLDLGCGNGSLSYSIATNRPGAKITAIDFNTKNLEIAKRDFSHPNILYLRNNILDKDFLSEQHFDNVVLSNILEHLSDRNHFLNILQKKFSPKHVLIRVPLFERDWRVPLKKELGVEWRLDPTHFIEYTMETWNDEIRKANLIVIYQEIRWGEIWAKAAPRL